MKNLRKFACLFGAFLIVFSTLPAPVFAIKDMDSGLNLPQKESAFTETANWAVVDFDQTVILPIKGGTDEYKMSDAVAMNYFNVPRGVQNLVNSYKKRIEELPEGSKFYAIEKELLRSDIESWMEDNGFEVNSIAQNETILKDEVIDLKSAPKMQISNYLQSADVKEVVSIEELGIFREEHAIYNATLEGLVDDVSEKKKLKRLESGQKISSLEVEENNGFFDFLSGLFVVQTAKADGPTPFIDYYDGIEKNSLDSALYYLSLAQNQNGSFGSFNEYELAMEVAFLLGRFNRTTSDQFNNLMFFLTETSAQNLREKAMQARVLTSLGQPTDQLLAEIVAAQNENGGFGIDKDYRSDVLTTLEVSLALYAADYSLQEALPKSLLYTVLKIDEEGKLFFTENSEPSYYLINKTAQNLYPFRSMSLANGEGVNISIQEKIDQLVAFLASHYDEETQKLLMSDKIVDLAMTLRTFQLYGVESQKQVSLRDVLQDNQSFDGSFGGALYDTIYAMHSLAQPDLVVTNIESTTSLINKSPATFRVTIENKGFDTASGVKIYGFVNNFDEKLNVNLPDMEPGAVINANINYSNTSRFLGDVELKFYLEALDESNYQNNWLSEDFNFASAANASPGLPIFYIAHKAQFNGQAAVNVRWLYAPDANRRNYLISYREKGATQWSYISAPSSWTGAYLSGGFQNDKTYELNVGVLYNDQQTALFSSQITEVKTHTDPMLYRGGVAGAVTAADVTDERVNLAGYSIAVTTDEVGNFDNQSVVNGSDVISPSDAQFDPIRSRFVVASGASTNGLRLFTRLKPDNEVPVVENLEIRFQEDLQIFNQSEVKILAYGSDNVAMKSADFYYWDPDNAFWQFISRENFEGDSLVESDWYIPADLVGAGYKIKTIFSDYQGNQSQPVEWGPFTLNDGSPPTFDVTSPNGGEAWNLGETKNISWTTSAVNGVSDVDIWLKYPSGALLLAEDVVNSGAFSWSIPLNYEYAGEEFKIEVLGADDGSENESFDQSDDYFSILDNSVVPPAPWGLPEVVTSGGGAMLDGHIITSKVVYSQNGDMHMMYLYMTDVAGNPRTINEQLVYLKKTSGSQSWAEPQIVWEEEFETDASMIGYKPMRNFEMAVGLDNRVHLVWERQSIEDCSINNDFEVFYTFFDGSTWAVPENISNNTSASTQPTLGVDASGNVYLAWLDGQMWSQACEVSGEGKIFFRKKVGQAWSAISELNLGLNPEIPQLIITDDSKVHLIYRVGTVTKNLSHAVYNGSWSVPVNFATGDFVDSSVAADVANNLHQTSAERYVDSLSGQTKYRITYSFFNGTSWSSVSNVVDSTETVLKFGPKITVDSQNKVSILYQREDVATGKTGLDWILKNQSGSWAGAKMINLPTQELEESEISFDVNEENLIASWIGRFSFRSEVLMNMADLSNSFNSAPIHDEPELESELGNNGDNENLILSLKNALDIDGDMIRKIVDWRLDGQSLAAMNLPMESFGGQEALKVKDYSLNRYEGTVNGATFSSSGGRDGFGHYIFDGNDSISFADKTVANFPDDSFSISVWVKTANQNASTYNGWILDTKVAGSATASGYSLFIFQNKALFRLGNGTAFSSIHGLNSNITDGNWHHIVGVVDRENSKMYQYVDGVFDGSANVAAGDYGNDYPLQIGKYNLATTHMLNGSIDELDIYKKAITQEQVASLYANGKFNIVAKETNLGQEWQACVTLNDGLTDGIEKCSNVLEIVAGGNNPPLQATPIINSEFGANTDAEQLSVSPQNISDVDGDAVKVIVNWLVDSKSFRSLNLPFESFSGDELLMSQDYSINQNNASVHGAVFELTSGDDGFGAYRFDGVSNYLEVQNGSGVDFPNDSFSVSVWLKTTNANANTYNGWILDTKRAGSGSESGYSLFLSNNRVVWRLGNGSQLFSTGSQSSNLTDGNWHHVVGVADRQNKKIYLYLDGQLEGTANLGDGDFGNDHNLYIGKYFGAASYLFKGWIDEVAVYDRALTAEQVAAEYSDGFKYIEAAETLPGEVWQACVVPNDGSVDGNEACSNEIEILP